ncbi:Peptidase family S58 [compost metagenome]
MKLKGSIVDVPGTKVGHAHNDEALTGCTVVIWEDGAVCSVDVRGSAPGTRETDLLEPTRLVDRVHAICLSGGSSYGLDAASGVMEFLEQKGIGADVHFGVVPIVPAAVLFDLSVGDPSVRPDRNMGYLAASLASDVEAREGNVGAGCGASVGKVGGFEKAMKGGLGTASISLPGGLVIGAIAAVNALGEVRDPATGEVLAGPIGDTGELEDSIAWLAKRPFSFNPVPAGTNTTLAIVASNANLSKSQVKKVAEMAQNGLARTIYPVHTLHDGDTVFAAATGGVDASVDLVGSLSAEVLAAAIVRAVQTSEPAGGLPAYRDLAGRRQGGASS